MSRESVLIAEDDRTTRRILEHLFESHPVLAERDFRLLLAADGREALHLFHRNSPVLVIVDLFMPRVDGFQVCRAIRNTGEGAFTPILVTSAVWKQPDILEPLRQECDVEFLEKPFQPENLAAMVIQMLDRSSADSAPEPTSPEQ